MVLYYRSRILGHIIERKELREVIALPLLAFED
jgi:hypothetical protein